MYHVKETSFPILKIRKLHYHEGFLLLIILFLSFLSLPGAVVAAQTPTYTVGVVPQFTAQRIYKIWRPILDELERCTQLKFKLKGSPSIPEFEHQLLAGKFDFAYMNPYHFLLANRKQGYLPLLRDHGKMLSGILVVRKDSPFKTIKDLNGKILAFPAPNALGASLLLRAELHNFYHVSIKPRYVRSHDSVYLNVVMGQVAAGGGVQKTFDRQPENIRNKLRIFHRTTEVFPHPIAAHPRVPEAVRQQVEEAFLKMGQTESGKKHLAQIPIKQLGAATLDDYHPVEKMNLVPFYVKPE